MPKSYTSFISISQAAKYLSISPDTLRNWDEQGKLVAERTIGGSRRYDLNQLQELKKQLSPFKHNHLALLSISKAAKLLEVSSDTLRNWDKKGMITTYRTKGGSRRFAKKDVMKFKNEIIVPLPQNLVTHTQNLGEPASVVSQSNKPDYLAGFFLGLFSIMVGFVLGLMIAPNVIFGLTGMTSQMQTLNFDFNRLQQQVANLTASVEKIEKNSKGDVLGESTTGDEPGQIIIREKVIAIDQQTLVKMLPPMVSTLQNQTGDLTLTAGSDIKINGLTIENNATLSSVKTRGGCDGCLSDGDIQDNLTTSADGNIDAAAIKTGVLPVQFGGTELTSFAKGDLLYASDINTLDQLKIATSGAILAINSEEKPVWDQTISIDIDNSRVGIGTSAPQSKLHLADGNLQINKGAICVSVSDTDDDCAGLDNGTIYASHTLIQAANLAEQYPSRFQLGPGQIVAIDIEGNGIAISKSNTSSSQSVIGVISSNPGIILNQNNNLVPGLQNYPVALAGRVLVKVSTENGSIKTGDLLTSSSVPGVAMKLIHPGQIIGYALTDFTCQSGNNCQGEVEMLVNLSFADPQNELAGVTDRLNELRSRLDSNEAKLTALAMPQIPQINTSEATLSGQVLNYKEGVFSSMLKSLGQTVLGSTIVAGDIVQDGTLTISSGNTIDAFPTLYLQKSNLAENIDLFNNLVTIDKQGVVSAQTLIALELKVKGGKSSGNGEIPIGQTSTAIKTSLVNKTSRILVTPTSSANIILAVTAKNPGEEFIVSISDKIDKSVTFDWWLVNEVPN